MMQNITKLVLALLATVSGNIGIQPFDFKKEECDSPD